VWHEIFGEQRVMKWLEFEDHCADAAAGTGGGSGGGSGNVSRTVAAPFEAACCASRPALMEHLTGPVTTWTLYERETSKFRGSFFWERPPSPTSTPGGGRK